MTRLQGLLDQLPKLDITFPLTSFTLLPKRPSELRNKICKYAAMVRRDISLQRGKFLAFGLVGNDQPEAPAIFKYLAYCIRSSHRRETILHPLSRAQIQIQQQ
jgi:hypothetical protein